MDPNQKYQLTLARYYASKSSRDLALNQRDRRIEESFSSIIRIVSGGEVFPSSYDTIPDPSMNNDDSSHHRYSNILSFILWH